MVLAATVLFLQPAGPAAAELSAPAALRIGLTYFNGAKQISVSSTSGISIVKTGSAGAIATAPPDSQITLQARAATLAIIEPDQSDRADAGASVTVTAVDRSTPVYAGASPDRHRQYPGSIEISVESGTIRVVNVVGLEDYVRGVVPAEMPDAYPQEALKAQAICVRGYALASLGRHSGQGFDLCDSGHCQGYLGVASNKPAAARAAAETAGQVLTFNARVASTLYSTDCGGITQDWSETRSSNGFSYLCSVSDPPETKVLCWEQSYKLDEIEQRLIKAGVKEAEGLEDISVARTSSSGRALSIRITGKQASASLTGERLRSIFSESLKSTMFTIEQSPDGTVTFKGKGAGHGLGLCQVGAKALALPPYNYTCARILAHYFPGTSLNTLATAGSAQLASGGATARPPIPARRSRRKHHPSKTDNPTSSGQADLDVRVVAPSL